MLFQPLLVPGLNFSLSVKRFSGLVSLHLHVRTITPLPLWGDSCVSGFGVTSLIRLLQDPRALLGPDFCRQNTQTVPVLNETFSLPLQHRDFSLLGFVWPWVLDQREVFE